MKIGSLDSSKQVLVVAEIGNNHEGDIDVAIELVDRAADAGVNAVKFQTYTPEHLSGSDPERLQKLRDFELRFEDLRRLAGHAEDKGLVWFSTAFDLENARKLYDMQPVFKIASGDNNFFSLIESVASFGKPMIVSTGLADTSLLQQVLARVKKVCCANGFKMQLAFLHCVSSYPTPINQAGLSAIPQLRSQFPDCEVGYSDHTVGIEAAVFSAAAGARIIEKHFTLDKTQTGLRDHQLSADPKEMKELVSQVRKVEVLLGEKASGIQECEIKNLILARRSIAANRRLDAGTVLSDDDLTCVRPGSGIPANEVDKVIGKKLVNSIAPLQLIELEDLK